MKTETQKPQNLMDGILSEMNRVREIIKEYDALPRSAGLFASTIMKASIKNAEYVIGFGDVIAMLAAYEDLKSYEL